MSTSKNDTVALRFNAGKPKLSMLTPEMWKLLETDLRGGMWAHYAPYAAAGYTLSILAHTYMGTHRRGMIRTQLQSVVQAIQAGVRQSVVPEDDPHGMYSTYAMLAGAMEHGAGVYGRNNWKLGFMFTELIDASQRHLLKLCTRHSDADKDTGVHHAGPAMFGVNSMLYMLEREDMFKRFYDVQPESTPTPKEGA